ELPTQARAAAHDQHVEHGHQGNRGEDRRHPGACRQQQASEGPALERRSLEPLLCRRGGQNTDAVGRAHWRTPARRAESVMMVSPIRLTTRVMASRISAAYISTCASRGPASGKLSARSAARVLAGENSERLIWFELPISMARAMVSPRARPNPRTSAPKIP